MIATAIIKTTVIILFLGLMALSIYATYKEEVKKKERREELHEQLNRIEDEISDVKVRQSIMSTDLALEKEELKEKLAESEKALAKANKVLLKKDKQIKELYDNINNPEY